MLTEHDAAEELLKRSNARKTLSAFVAYLHPEYEVADHHRILCEHLEAVERGDIRRLVITMPPGHAKSEYASRHFPAWIFGKHDDWKVIHASHNQDLANEFSYDVREIMRDERYMAVFGARLSEDRGALEAWRTSAGGRYRAAGIGASITGRRGNLAIIDDPDKDRKSADSENAQKDQERWFTSTLYTRLWPQAPIVIILTRWHESDIVGRRLEAMEHGGERWTVLEMPALIESAEDARRDALGRGMNEPLWPAAGFTRERLLEIKRTVGPRDWSALYQCQPTPEGGDYFQRDWFAYYDERPRALRYYLTSDFAVSEDAQADPTVHIVWGVDDQSDLYVVDVWRDWRLSDESVDIALDLIAEWRVVAWINEKGVILKSLGPFIEKRMRERRIVCRWGDDVRYARVVDKVMGARTYQARMSMGKVKIPRNAPWRSEFEREHLSFPAGKHDDQVDCGALMGMHLDKLVRPKRGDGRTLPRLVVNFDPLGRS